MINLSAYDNVTIVHDTWIDSKYKRLYSKSIPYRPFFTLLKRYNNEDNRTDYYLVLSDEVTPDKVFKGVAKSPKKFLKFDLSTFWKDLDIGNIGVAEISYERVESADNADIYYLDL